MNRSTSSRLSERQGLNMDLNKLLYFSSNPELVSRVDQNALPIGASKFSLDDTFIACERSNWSKLRSTPRAVRNAPGAARNAWGKTDGAKLVAEMPARAPNAAEIPGARKVAEMPARTPVGARIIVADKEAARAMGAPALVWARLNLSRPNCTPPYTLVPV